MTPRSPYGHIEYLALVDGQVMTVTIAITTYAAMKAAIDGRKPLPTTRDWDMLAAWIRDEVESGDRSLDEIPDLVRLVRPVLSAHLKRGWAASPAMRKAMKRAIEGMDDAALRLPADRLYRWVRLFLAC